MLIDIYIFQQINGLAGNYFWLDDLGIFFAKHLGYFFAFALLALFIKNYKRDMVIQAFLAGILARIGITEIIRAIAPKSRPFVENNVNLILNHYSTSSFPSGHAAFFFALSAVVYFHNKKAGVIAFFASFLISVSRVFCGIHWPSDIFAGAMVGIFSGWLIFKLRRKKEN